MSIKATSSALGQFEPQLSYTFLPRCPECAAPHPLAQGRADLHNCPDCGYPSTQPVTRCEKAALGGLWGKIAAFCFAIGKVLAALAKRV